MWSAEIDSILSAGRSLEEVGVSNWALERQAALAAIERLSRIGVAILGGDVYLINASEVELTYDNWHCNQETGESDLEFVKRSVTKARNYITQYEARKGAVLFAVVPRLLSSSAARTD